MCRSGLLLICALLCPGLVQAGPITVYSNFGAGNSFDQTNSLFLGGEAIAVPFAAPAVPLGSEGMIYSLTEIDFAASTGDPENPVTLGFYDSLAGLPGNS